jgi:uroporphyrinogen-III synthase
VQIALQVTLRWMSDNAAPLMILTRPAAQSARFAQQCRDRFGDRIEIVTAPLLRIEPIIKEIDLTHIAALAFTSENGVRVFADISKTRSILSFCVGARTAEVAQGYGLDAFSADGTVADLIEMIGQRATGPILHLRGVHVRGDLVATLIAKGLTARELAIYDQIPMQLPAQILQQMSGDRPILLPIFSPRTAQLLGDALAGTQTGQIHLPCLSAAVRDALPAHLQASASVSVRPTADAMLERVSILIFP